MNWHGSRHNETYTFREVEWRTGAEIGTYTNIISGSVELSALSDIKATCSFEFEGGEAPDTNNYARIYYSFIDDNGETMSPVPIGTFIVSYAKTLNDGVYQGETSTMKTKGTVEGYGLLKRLADHKLGYSLCIPAGTNTITKAKQLIEADNLTHNNPTNPNYTTKSAHTFEPNDSYLTVVNWLLTNTTPQYQGAYVNAYGQVQITPYIDPSAREVVETFKDDATSIFLSTVTVDNDWQNTANDMYLSYEDQNMSLTAHAYVEDGAKFAYNQNGHRYITADVNEISELSGNSTNTMLANLRSMAVQALKDACNEIEHVTIKHAYVDTIQPNSAVAIEYAGRSWSGNVTNMTIELKPSTMTTTKMRRFISNDLVINESGWINWQA